MVMHLFLCDNGCFWLMDWMLNVKGNASFYNSFGGWSFLGPLLRVFHTWFYGVTRPLIFYDKFFELLGDDERKV